MFHLRLHQLSPASHAVLLADGEFPTLGRLRVHRQYARLLIALDGAANRLHAWSERPDIIIGDLDSYRNGFGSTVPVVHDPDQETNDLEKGLRWALRQGITSAVVLGATGLRLDHTLKNLSVLKQFDEQLTLWFEDQYAEIRLMTAARSQLELRGHVGQPVSLFPLSGRVEGIVTEGLKYPLHDEALENGVRDGSSNELIGTHARITLRSGDLLVFLNIPEEGR